MERDLEAWLIHHTERLVQIGYDVRLRRQQFVLPDRRRPDLVFDLTEDDGSTGTLIVELKATNGYLGAVDQLAGYMDAFLSLGLASGVLRGLLIADGIPPDVRAYADEKGIDTATLTELGYRRDLASATTTNPIRPIADNEPETIVQTFIIHSVPSQGDSATPVMYLDADGIDGLPTAVRPYDPDDEQHAEMASQLWQSVLDHPEFNTVGHIAVSYGGVTNADGSTVNPRAISAEENLGPAAGQHPTSSGIGERLRAAREAVAGVALVEEPMNAHGPLQRYVVFTSNSDDIGYPLFALWATSEAVAPVHVEDIEGGTPDLAEYARELITNANATCLGVTSRMGYAAYLVPDDNHIADHRQERS